MWVLVCACHTLIQVLKWIYGFSRHLPYFSTTHPTFSPSSPTKCCQASPKGCLEFGCPSGPAQKSFTENGLRLALVLSGFGPHRCGVEPPPAWGLWLGFWSHCLGLLKLSPSWAPRLPRPHLGFTGNMLSSATSPRTSPWTLHPRLNCYWLFFRNCFLKGPLS